MSLSVGTRANRCEREIHLKNALFSFSLFLFLLSLPLSAIIFSPGFRVASQLSGEFTGGVYTLHYRQPSTILSVDTKKSLHSRLCLCWGKNIRGSERQRKREKQGLRETRFILCNVNSLSACTGNDLHVSWLWII